MKDMLTESCRPYDTGNETDPVQMWDVVDRLTPFELRRLAIALAIHKADVFEERILEFWTARQS